LVGCTKLWRVIAAKAEIICVIRKLNFHVIYKIIMHVVLHSSFNLVSMFIFFFLEDRVHNLMNIAILDPIQMHLLSQLISNGANKRKKKVFLSQLMEMRSILPHSNKNVLIMLMI
jgi:hypothetical protein